jgi:hypothetical protein
MRWTELQRPWTLKLAIKHLGDDKKPSSNAGLFVVVVDL